MFTYIADLITFDLLHLEAETSLATAVNFFVYDVLQILFLIFLVVSFIAFLRTYIAPHKIKKIMQRSRFGIGNLAASTFGALTPFCSCSSIPIFIGFIKAEIPLGIAFSFLVTSPLVNEVAFVIMGGLFGWKLAILYAVSGIILGIIAGLILGSLKMEKNVILDECNGSCSKDERPERFKAKIKYAFKEGKNTFIKLLPYVIGGVALGAIIHGYVPKEFFESYIGEYRILAVPIAVILGIPIYAGCSTLVPLIFTITANGVPLGTSLAFMMSIAGLSFPEAVILKRVMTIKLLIIFFGIVGLGIILIGYLFNFLGGSLL